LLPKQYKYSTVDYIFCIWFILFQIFWIEKLE
jgi:hypothetical protein